MAHEEFEGIAALRALGIASPEEERAFTEHVRECEECGRAELEYREAAAMIGQSIDPIAPPPSTRSEVLASIGDDAEDDGSFWRKNTWWLATAATLFLALWGWREIGVRVSRERVVSQAAEIKELQHQNDLLRQQRDRLASEMAAIGAEATQTIALTGQQASPEASARVFLETEKRRAIVFFTNLPRNPNDKSYQLWVIRADQPSPQSVGVFDAENGNAAITIENLPVATEIKGLALTLEQRGGSPQPTNTNYYVLGTI